MSLLPARPLQAAVLLGALSFGSAFTHADDLRLEAPSLPASLLQEGKVDVVIEASGIEPIGDGRRLLVAHENIRRFATSKLKEHEGAYEKTKADLRRGSERRTKSHMSSASSSSWTYRLPPGAPGLNAAASWRNLCITGFKASTPTRFVSS